MGESILARALPVALALALVAAPAPLLHEHRADAPALHDNGCALAQLAVAGAEIGLSPVVDFVASLALAGIAFLPPPPDAPDAAHLASASRGPPVAG